MPVITRRQSLLSAAAVTAIAAQRPRPSWAADTIRIGFTTALTGPFNEFGEGYRRGVELALMRVNKAGGVMGRQVEIGLMLDDQLVPDRAVQNMRRILDDTSIVGLIAPSGSGPTLAVVDMVTADGRPILNPQAQTPSIVYPNGRDKPPRSNLFSVSILNDVEASFMASVVASKFKRIGLLHESTGYGKTGGQLMRSEIQRQNKDATALEESYNQKDQDMTAQLVRMQRARAEVLVVVGLGADLAVIRKNMVRMNLNIPLYTLAGGLTRPYVEGAGDLVVGTHGSSFAKTTKQPLAPETQAFFNAYKAKYGTDRWWGPDPTHPDPAMAGTVGTGYDCAGLLCDAFQRAGSTEPAAVIKALEATQGFPGANDTYTFSTTVHDAIRPTDLALYAFAKVDDRIELRPATS